MAEVQHSTVFDPAQEHLGGVYAKALLGATEKAGISELVLSEFDSLIKDVLDAMPRFDAVLCSPRVPFGRKERMLNDAFAKRMTPQLLSFVKVVTRRGRFDCMRAIHRAAGHLLNELRDRVEVLVRSAEPLDESTLALVTQRLRVALAKDVDVQLKVDPTVLAGLVIRVGDTVYDGSAANQLSRLRDEMISQTNQKIRLESQRFSAAE
jgi:F-type H+-transporting ATPase subunit delta